MSDFKIIPVAMPVNPGDGVLVMTQGMLECMRPMGPCHMCHARDASLNGY